MYFLQREPHSPLDAQVVDDRQAGCFVGQLQGTLRRYLARVQRRFAALQLHPSAAGAAFGLGPGPPGSGADDGAADAGRHEGAAVAGAEAAEAGGRRRRLAAAPHSVTCCCRPARGGQGGAQCCCDR